jgi:hypothetical protein
MRPTSPPWRVPSTRTSAPDDLRTSPLRPYTAAAGDVVNQQGGRVLRILIIVIIVIAIAYFFSRRR